MASFEDDLASALQPYLGTATEAYVQSLAAGVSKHVGSLTVDDLPAIEAELRLTISAVAASSTIDSIIRDIRGAS